MKAKLTVRCVEGITPGASDIICWDTELANFACKVTPRGRRTYFLYYRTNDRVQRRPTIGVHGPMRPEAAREIARRWLADVAQGKDPSQSRTDSRTAPIVRDLCERYMAEYAVTRKKPTSIRNDRQLIDSHLLPALGTKKVAAVTRTNVMDLHHKLRATPYLANRVVALISKMFALAERWGMRADGTNPAKNIDRYKEEMRERYLTSDEVARLWRVLNSDAATATASTSAVAAIKLLMLSGRRLNEVLSLQWAWVDLDAKLLRLPDTKGGKLTVSLADAALSLLRQLKDKSGQHLYVIPGSIKGKPLVNLQKPWRALRAIAGLEDVRIHDLRHTFASIGAGMGMSLHMLGRLLGHTQASTTSRYAHLAQSPVQAAADAIGAELMRLAESSS